MSSSHSLRLLALGLLTLGSVALAADNASKTDWSQYVPFSTITAEVRQVDNNSVTVRVYWTEAEVVRKDNDRDNDKNKNRNKNNNNRNNKNGKNNNRNQPNPLQRLIQQARNNQQRIEYHQEHHDYDLKYMADTSVTGKVATSPDEKGKPMPATPMDLRPGMVVIVSIVRDKDIPAQEVKEKHLVARGITVVGMNPNYKRDPSDTPKKK